MAREVINVGASPNDGTGDPIRTSFIKTNNNFGELYARAKDNPPATLVGTIGDVAGMYAYDSVYFYYCFQDYDGSSIIWAEIPNAVIGPSSIGNGTSDVSIPVANGNVSVSVAGVSNTVVFTSTETIINGNLTVSGNATLSGNILGDIINNGTTSIEIQTPGGNANITVGGTTNTVVFTSTSTQFAGNVLPAANAIYSLGNSSRYWANLWVANNTIYIGGVPLGITAGNVLTVGGNAVLSNDSATSISTTGNITANYFIGDGSLLTGVSSSYGNANVVANLAALASNPITTSGNVSAGYFIGDGSQLTGTYGNANVVANLAALGANPINTTANVTAAYFVGDGSQLTGLPAVYGNANVATFLAAYGSNTISTTGNITANYFAGNGSLLTGIVTTAAPGGGNTQVQFNDTGSMGGSAAFTFEKTSNAVTMTGNLSAGNLSTTNITGTIATASQPNITALGNLISLDVTGNVTGSYFLGNGSLLTGIVTSFTPGGANTQVQFNDAGNIGGSAAFTFDQSTNAVSVTGNVTSANLSVGTGSITVGNIVCGAGNLQGTIGDQTTWFGNAYIQAVNALYADLAECYLSDDLYQSGTVVKFGGSEEITMADRDHDPEVAGVISTNPAYLMNTSAQGSHVLAVALAGRVPCRVIGPVRKGQMMVSAGAGRARAELNPAMGTVIGKALQDFEGEQGVIEIVVGRL